MQVVRRTGSGTAAADSVLASAPLTERAGATIQLRIAARRGVYDFFYATTRGRWTPLLANADGKILSTKVAGGFVGTLFGLHAFSAR